MEKEKKFFQMLADECLKYNTENIIKQVIEYSHFSEKSDIEKYKEGKGPIMKADLKVEIGDTITVSYVDQALYRKKMVYKNTTEYHTEHPTPDYSPDTELTKQALAQPTKMTLMHLVTGQSVKAKMVDGTLNLVETIWDAVEVKPSTA